MKIQAKCTQLATVANYAYNEIQNGKGQSDLSQFYVTTQIEKINIL